jgi:hypothetical protein
MKTIIAGSRGIEDYGAVVAAVDMARLFGIEVTEVLSGTARGVDRLGERYAAEHGLPCQHFPAPWHRYPRTAGRMRNVQMARRAEALIAIWDGVSPGTAHMIKIAREHGLAVWVHDVEPQ